MNPEAILALISDLYIQVSSAQARIAELEEQLEQEPVKDPSPPYDDV